MKNVVTPYMVPGNFYIAITKDGKNENVLCGPEKEDVGSKLVELNSISTIENPILIRRFFYFTLSCVELNYRITRESQLIRSV